MSDQDLAGIRVVAVEQAVAAPLCSRHLADLGADVIKIEHPDMGDFARYYDETVRGEASHFVWLNRGKRSVALDLKSQDGLAEMRQLLSTADVLLSNLAPGAMDRIIPDDVLERLNPRLIRCHVSGYGATGPYSGRKAYDLLIQGEAGTVAATGTPDQPAKPGVSLADLAGGAYALAAINAALYARERSGRGQRLEIALFDVLLEWMSPLLLAQLHAGAAPEPAGVRHASICPYGPFSTSEGDVLLLAIQNERQWQRLCTDVLEAPKLVTDPALASNSARTVNRERVEGLVQAALSRYDAAEATRRLTAADVPYARLNQIADVLEHPQARATGRWSPATLPSGDGATVVTSPFHDRPEPAPGRAVPRLGEHTEEVLREGGR